MNAYQNALEVGTSTIQLDPGDGVYRGKIFSTGKDMAIIDHNTSPFLKSMIVSGVVNEGESVKDRFIVLDMSNVSQADEYAIGVISLFGKLSREKGYEAAVIGNGPIHNAIEEKYAHMDVNIFDTMDDMAEYLKEHGHI